MEDDDPAAAGLIIPKAFIRRVKLSVASNEEIVNTSPLILLVSCLLPSIILVSCIFFSSGEQYPTAGWQKLMAHPVENPIPITHCSQLQDNPSLGLPLQVGSRCESCGATQLDKCEGHFGYIKLPEPIYHPSHVAELGKILNLVCLCCLRLKKPKVRVSQCRPRIKTLPQVISVKDLQLQI